jgi:hypothetical protein
MGPSRLRQMLPLPRHHSAVVFQIVILARIECLLGEPLGYPGDPMDPSVLDSVSGRKL